MFSKPKMIRLSAALVALAGASGLAGCGSSGGSTAEGASGTSADAISAAVPKQDWFAIDLAAHPGGAQVSTKSVRIQSDPPSSSCESGTPAQFAVLSHQISSSANGAFTGIMGMVAQITSQPPTAKSDTHAVWGPITDPANPSVYRFDVQRVDEAIFAFRLEGRPKAGDESTWRGVLEGTVAPIDDAHRTGEAHVDFAAAHALDPANGPTGGSLELHFEATADARMIALTFAGVTGPGAPAPNDAVYTYAQPRDGVGTFEFVTRTDFDNDGKQDELLNVKSRWDDMAGGQAVVTVIGGSLPKPVVATECWNAKGGAVFYADDATVHAPAGDASCCPK